MYTNIFAAVVSDNDGSAFITKAEFDSLEEKAIVPEGIETIGPEAFYSDGGNNGVLEAVTLPSTLKEIGEYAFFRKKNLREISFPSGLLKIKKKASEC